ncbi:DUF6895 family protein [Kitasatospora sp. CB01950]|uniref:DUF6895 family protein n=1 Tax=Kitasatospora sp. CB01950 TaxID=1703930 RepID=UPI00093B9F64|nr:hypothetical protein [Kitasatospora sp. CB01950]OKJ13881.1 hypothetical protein AMK19_10895 [Kitasatospora sp. CB01950]
MNETLSADCHRLATRSLEWLQRTHEQGNGLLPPDDDIDVSDPNNAYKPIGEAALAASLVLREKAVLGPAERDRARAVLDFGWQQLRQGELLYERQFRNILLSDPLELYGHFHRSGYRHAPLDELLAGLDALRSTHALEAMANRRLATVNARYVIGLESRPDWDALAKTTWLGERPEPWAIDWITGYNVTHAVFHLTDWGAVPGRLPEPMQDYLALWLPVWVDIWQETGQWDLLGELLIVDACLSESVCDPQSWAQLASVQHEDGLLPRDLDPVDEDPARAFKDNEHTAVVGVLAGTLTLARDRR